MGHKIESYVKRRRAQGFTLSEVIVSIGVAAITMLAVINGYLATARRTEWAALAASAHVGLVERMEQVRAAQWDLTVFPPVDELIQANFPVDIRPLNHPCGSSNIVYATNRTTIKLVQANPPVKLIKTVCIWPFMNGKNYTNTMVLYRSPNP